ncbi:FMN-binding protein [Dactylosporangium sp. NPDC049140]|jgi:uncharacterized protein with FMN-binding domain|uniref:FMN-binding protein n=1 Tax=Dactylosporangium sp. NPDC049140 TaxID=3155647 RepID=UPI0033E1F9A9
MIVSTFAAVVLLFSYRTSTQGPGTGPGTPSAAAQRPGIVAATPAQSGAGGTTSSSPPNSLTVNGTTAHTRYGPVQVQVQITGGKITDVTTLQHPSGDRRNEQISSYALPQLRTEALSAQNAHIDTVSGATYTSDGYIESLQAALDAAHVG